MPKLPKYLQKNADELRAIRQDQPTPTYEEALRQVQRVERREGVFSSDSTAKEISAYLLKRYAKAFKDLSL